MARESPAELHVYGIELLYDETSVINRKNFVSPLLSHLWYTSQVHALMVAAATLYVLEQFCRYNLCPVLEPRNFTPSVVMYCRQYSFIYFFNQTRNFNEQGTSDQFVG
jgi:hypothetical protein